MLLTILKPQHTLQPRSSANSRNYTPYDYDSHYLGLQFAVLVLTVIVAVTHAPLLYAMITDRHSLSDIY